MKDTVPCPICRTQLESDKINTQTMGDFIFVDCPRCTKYKMSRSVLHVLPEYLVDESKITSVSYAVRKMNRGRGFPFINSYTFESMLKTVLPGLADQINSLILWIGGNSDPGEWLTGEIVIVQSIIGSKTKNGVTLLINYLIETKLLEKPTVRVGEEGEEEEEDDNSVHVKLTYKGWGKYEEIKRGAVMSKKAFMAMKYGDEELDWIFENCFKPAVKATGFDLFRLDEIPKAGLIDDRLRVEISTSRFLISDLTHENAGAYWEAGFAEGLGKPVIYTCEEKKFETQKTHFDTNHHLTIIWEKAKYLEVIEKMKATIRTTLPDESTLTDSE